MDWQTALAWWGPAIVLLPILIKAHRDVIYKIVPDGFKRIEKAIAYANEQADERHVGHMEAMRQLCRCSAKSHGRPTKKKRARKRRKQK